MIFYAIKHKPSGHYLPQLRRRRGYTHTEPTPLDKDVPRLHRTARAAKVALWYWLQGTWSDHYTPAFEFGAPEYDGNEPVAVPSRKAEDMEIVVLEVREVVSCS